MYDFSGPLNSQDTNAVYSVVKTNKLLIAAMSVLIFDIILKIWVGTSLLSGILLFIPWGVKTLPFGLVIAGTLSATALFPGSSNHLYVLRFSATQWGFDQLYARSLVNMVLDWGRISWSAGDKGLFMVPPLKINS
jgi:hypothetical protein